MFCKGHIFAYKTDEIWAWGYNDQGQLGNLSIVNVSSPIQVVSEHKFVIIDGDVSSSIGIKQNGSAWTWGVGTALGDNTTTGKSSPVAVVGDHSFIEASMGYQYALALKSNGQCWAWGINANGQLGTNNSTQYSSPVQVVGDHSFIKIQAGGGYSLNRGNSGGLKSDGSLWNWGCNVYGQLGNNTASNTSSPVAVVGEHSFVDFVIGQHSRLGLKVDGSVWSWGENLYGVLGTNDTTSYSSPVQVVGNHSFIKIAMSCSGSNPSNPASAGLKADGSVWTWGIGGALGNNTTTSVSSPVQVVGDHSFIDITGGLGPFFCAMKSDGTIWGWGINTRGQLGVGNTTQYSSPVQVIGDHSFLTLRTGSRMNLYNAGNNYMNPVIFLNINGVWKKVIQSYICNNGVWNRFKYR